jgi:hypothetical protein
MSDIIEPPTASLPLNAACDPSGLSGAGGEIARCDCTRRTLAPRSIDRNGYGQIACRTTLFIATVPQGGQIAGPGAARPAIPGAPAADPDRVMMAGGA